MNQGFEKVLIEFHKSMAHRSILNDFFVNDIEQDRSGVYLIYSSDNKPLYIGQSVNLRRRLRNHINNSEFRDEIGYFQIIYMKDKLVEDKEERRKVESLLIDILNPKYNVKNRGESQFEEIVVFNKVDYNEPEWWKNRPDKQRLCDDIE